MTLNIENETEKEFEFDPSEVADAVINEVLDSENFPYEAEVSILITDDHGINEINKEQRNIDRPTDVLSFPMIEYERPGDFDAIENADDCINPETGEVLLGDIVISIDKVEEQAREYGHS